MTGPLIPASRSRGAALLLCTSLAVSAAAAAHPPAARGEEAMVVTSDAQATRVGVEVLRSGGNAADAAVAVAFVLAVTFPQAGNLGGGGFLLFRSAQGRHEALDFRERAPAGLEAARFLDEEGRPVPGLSLGGGLSVGVPGTVAGLAEIHRRWGSRPWKDLVAPAIRLAEEGFAIPPFLARSLAVHAAKLGADPEARSIFLRNGEPPPAGERLVQTDLAAALRRIAENGPAGFYEGTLAGALVRAVRGAGGVMTAEDLGSYRPSLRTPLVGTYRGYRVVSFPPPSSGGVALLQMLGMLEPHDLRAAGPGSSLAVHLMAEAQRRAFADRSRWLGDPDFYDVPVEGLLAPDYLARRAADIRQDRATPSLRVLPGEPARPESPDTLHFSVADEAGRVAALTATLNAAFGNGIVAQGTGILLNNEIDDFALAPGAPNTYGLLGGEANAIAGGKRPLSSMTPTIVERPGGGPRPALVLGSPGGGAIITAVLQVLVNVIDHDLPLQEAVDAPRFHHQWQPDRIQHELRAFPADVRRNLLERGHLLEETDDPLGNVNAIGLDARGAWLGAADPRRQGAAAGF